MNRTLYICDLCGVRTTYPFLFKKLPIPVLYHQKFTSSGEVHTSDHYGWRKCNLCPDCQDKLAFFEADVKRDNKWERPEIKVREGRLPNPGIRIPDSEKVDWEIVEVE